MFLLTKKQQTKNYILSQLKQTDDDINELKYKYETQLIMKTIENINNAKNILLTQFNDINNFNSKNRIIINDKELFELLNIKKDLIKYELEVANLEIRDKQTLIDFGIDDDKILNEIITFPQCKN